MSHRGVRAARQSVYYHRVRNVLDSGELRAAFHANGAFDGRGWTCAVPLFLGAHGTRVPFGFALAVAAVPGTIPNPRLPIRLVARLAWSPDGHAALLLGFECAASTTGREVTRHWDFVNLADDGVRALVSALRSKDALPLVVFSADTGDVLLEHVFGTATLHDALELALRLSTGRSTSDGRWAARRVELMNLCTLDSSAFFDDTASSVEALGGAVESRARSGHIGHG